MHFCKRPGASKFTANQESNRLIKINFTAKMAESWKNLATKKPVQNAFDLGDKIDKKN